MMRNGVGNRAVVSNGVNLEYSTCTCTYYMCPQYIQYCVQSNSTITASHSPRSLAAVTCRPPECLEYETQRCSIHVRAPCSREEHREDAKTHLRYARRAAV